MQTLCFGLMHVGAKIYIGMFAVHRMHRKHKNKRMNCSPFTSFVVSLYATLTIVLCFAFKMVHKRRIKCAKQQEMWKHSFFGFGFGAVLVVCRSQQRLISSQENAILFIHPSPLLSSFVSSLLKQWHRQILPFTIRLVTFNPHSSWCTALQQAQENVCKGYNLCAISHNIS